MRKFVLMKRSLKNTKYQARIYLTAIKNEKIYIAFEAYRLARMLDVYGYIQTMQNKEAKIVIQGTEDVIDTYLDRITAIAESSEASIQKTKDVNLEKYSEFRIIHFKLNN